jgi:chromosome segregation ATPase
MDKVKRLDEQVKSRIQEQKNAKSKLPYKSVEDIENQIDSLQKQVDGGMMKLVDEKKALSEISQLNRAKKSFGGFDASQKAIDDLRAQIADLKKGLDDPEAKALSEKYNSLQNELNQIKSEQDEVYKNLNSLRDQRTKLHGEQQEAYVAWKTYKDEHFAKIRAFREYEQEAYRIRKEKQRKENDEYHAGKRREAAEKRLEEASAPAYEEEILTAQGLIRYFDPSSVPAKEASAPSNYAASAGRTVNDGAFKGMKVMKKDEEDFMTLGGGKKKKGGKKSGAAATEKFNLNIRVLEDLSKVKVDTPSSQADVPRVVEDLKKRVEEWKADQEKETQKVGSWLNAVSKTSLLIYYRTLRRPRRRLRSSRLRLLRARAPLITRRSPRRRTLVLTAMRMPPLNSRKRKTLLLTPRGSWHRLISRTTSSSSRLLEPYLRLDIINGHDETHS